MPVVAPRRFLAMLAASTIGLAALLAATGPGTGVGAPTGLTVDVELSQRTAALMPVEPQTTVWTPAIAFSDENVSVELDLTGGDFTLAFIDTVDGILVRDAVLPDVLNNFAPPLWPELIQIYDDGTNGDQTAGDEVWSRSEIQISASTLTHDGVRIRWSTYR
jgi:hypothetical protein